MEHYAFNNVWVHARERLRGLEMLLDPATIRHLEALGVAEGWRCLEIGAGGGSVAAWLCQRVGPTGYVMATDLELRFLEALRRPNLHVCRHDIATDDLPESQFDLVLSRLVLEHVHERDEALRRMRSALKPGGWLFCEDADNTSVGLVIPADDEHRALFAKIERAKDQVMAGRGHVYCGRHLYALLHAMGLHEVRAEGRVPFLYAGTAPARWKRLSVEQLRNDIVSAHLATNSEVDAYLTLLDSPSFVAQGFTVTTAWGRRALVESRPARPM